MLTSKKELTVLIIDDNPDDLFFYSKLLSSSNKNSYQVLTAQDFESAAKILEENRTDLFLIDFNLPGTNGLEILSQLQNIGQSSIPAIMLTGAYTKELGAAHYIIKDIGQSVEEFDLLIDKVL